MQIQDKLVAGTDHPRSRGVYSAYPYILASQPGSSPLARGLPKY